MVDQSEATAALPLAPQATGQMPAAATAATRPPARFTQGSTMRHVIVMTATGSLGLMAVFVVELLTLLYIARLGDDSLTAGIGYAALLVFTATSVNIGLMIAAGALVSRAIGAGQRDDARRLAGSIILIMVIMGVCVTALLLILAVPMLTLVGAKGHAFDTALLFLSIVLPANVLMAAGMGFSGVLRAVGDANRAMYVTLTGAIVTAILDPILIYGLNLGVVGAGLGVIGSRLAFTLVGYYGAVHVHNMVERPNLADLRKDTKAAFNIAGPAILTNLATPISGMFLARILQPYGEAAIAANAIIDRLVPVAFGVTFALSGAVGPILGQNWGAKLFPRMRQAMVDSFVFVIIYMLVAWLILALGRNWITGIFGATGETATYVGYFCLLSGLMWMFNGFLFVANAAFNNLGFPLQSTLFNWGKATLGTVPFAYIGLHYAGILGVYIGMTLGAVIFGVWAAWSAMKVIGTLTQAPA
jgi:putative MATE family efflux protein